MDRPAKDGSYQTAWRRRKEWEAQGRWEKRWKRWRHLLEWGYREKKRSLEGVGVEATTKVHAVRTAQGALVGVEGTSARKPEGAVFSRVLRTAPVGGRTRPREVAGDGAYDSRPVRAERRRRGIRAGIPVNPRHRRGSRWGRPDRFDPDTDRGLRGAVERFFAGLKGDFRRLARRHKRLLATFQGFVHLACFLITWRVLR